MLYLKRSTSDNNDARADGDVPVVHICLPLEKIGKVLRRFDKRYGFGY